MGTIQQCAILCDDDDNCLGFKYGADYRGHISLGSYNPQDCQLSSSRDTYQCDGRDHNLDFYMKVITGVAVAFTVSGTSYPGVRNNGDFYPSGACNGRTQYINWESPGPLYLYWSGFVWAFSPNSC